MIRTLEQLQEAIDKDHAWRKKELSVLFSFIKSTSQGPLLSFYLRSGLALLYAHWEGFIKCISEYYLEFVSAQLLDHKYLKSCFIAINLKGKLNQFQATNKTSINLKVIDELISSLPRSEKIPFKNIIQAKSNLNSAVLEEILITLGLSNISFELKRNLIDEKLLKSRNKIAHGEYLDFNFATKEFKLLYVEVSGMMIDFKNEIILSATNKNYLRDFPISI